MKFKDYAQRFNLSGDVTFIVARAEKDDSSPFFHPVYRPTPIRTTREWLASDEFREMNILNDHQPPIDWLSGARWGFGFERGWINCLLVISDEDMQTLYPGPQAQSILDFIEREITKKH